MNLSQKEPQDYFFAASFNTRCVVRATLIEGDWDSESCSRVYSDGYVDGSCECSNQREALLPT